MILILSASLLAESSAEYTYFCNGPSVSERWEGKREIMDEVLGVVTPNINSFIKILRST